MFMFSKNPKGCVCYYYYYLLYSYLIKSFEAALNNIFFLKELLNNSECLDNSFFINDYDENQLLSQNHMFFILSENESLDNIVNEQTFEENKRIIERLKLYCDSKEKYFKFQLSKG